MIVIWLMGCLYEILADIEMFYNLIMNASLIKLTVLNQFDTTLISKDTLIMIYML